jgi:hypothetical protein
MECITSIIDFIIKTQKSYRCFLYGQHAWGQRDLF